MDATSLLIHPIRREIDASVSIWGMEPDDIIVFVGIAYLVSALTGSLQVSVGPVGVELFIKAAAIGAAFSLWMLFRRGKPRYYVRDVLRHAGEPDIWAVTDDLGCRPVLRGD